MEPKIVGQIEFDQIPSSRGLRRFTHKNVRNWIKNHFRMSPKNDASYFVEFSREGSGHIFNCQIKVRLGSQTWVGHNYEGGVHQALIQCLSRMMVPVPIPA